MPLLVFLSLPCIILTPLIRIEPESSSPALTKLRLPRRLLHLQLPHRRRLRTLPRGLTNMGVWLVTESYTASRMGVPQGPRTLHGTSAHEILSNTLSPRRIHHAVSRPLGCQDREKLPTPCLPTAACSRLWTFCLEASICRRRWSSSTGMRGKRRRLHSMAQVSSPSWRSPMNKRTFGHLPRFP